MLEGTMRRTESTEKETGRGWWGVHQEDFTSAELALIMDLTQRSDISAGKAIYLIYILRQVFNLKRTSSSASAVRARILKCCCMRKKW